MCIMTITTEEQTRGEPGACSRNRNSFDFGHFASEMPYPTSMLCMTWHGYRANSTSKFMHELRNPSCLQEPAMRTSHPHGTSRRGSDPGTFETRPQSTGAACWSASAGPLACTLLTEVPARLRLCVSILDSAQP